jgi:hypothetical protein
MALIIFFRIVIALWNLEDDLNQDGNLTPQLLRKMYGILRSVCPNMGKMKMNMKSDDMFAFLLPFISEWILNVIKDGNGVLDVVFATEFMKKCGIVHHTSPSGLLSILTYDQLKQIFDKLDIKSSFDDLYSKYDGQDPYDEAFDNLMFLNKEIMPYLNYWIVHEVIFVEYYKYDFSKFKFSGDDKLLIQAVLMFMGAHVAQKRVRLMS